MTRVCRKGKIVEKGYWDGHSAKYLGKQDLITKNCKIQIHLPCTAPNIAQCALLILNLVSLHSSNKLISHYSHNFLFCTYGTVQMGTQEAIGTKLAFFIKID